MARREIKIRIFDKTLPSRESDKLKNPTPLLKQIGLTLLRESSSAFERQAFGEFAWPPRYPNQAEPFVNIAGAVTDLAKSATIKGRRFDRRPALHDTGRLKGSLAPGRAMSLRGPYTVEVGSNLEYAGVHNRGGESKLPVTQTVKDNLAKYMKRLRGQLKNAKKSRGEGLKALFLSAKNLAVQKLGYLFQIDTLVTKINRRPFVGITQTAEKDINELVVDFFAGGR